MKRNNMKKKINVKNNENNVNIICSKQEKIRNEMIMAISKKQQGESNGNDQMKRDSIEIWSVKKSMKTKMKRNGKRIANEISK